MSGYELWTSGSEVIALQPYYNHRTILPPKGHSALVISDRQYFEGYIFNARSITFIRTMKHLGLSRRVVKNIIWWVLSLYSGPKPTDSCRCLHPGIATWTHLIYQETITVFKGFDKQSIVKATAAVRLWLSPTSNSELFCSRTNFCTYTIFKTQNEGRWSNKLFGSRCVSPITADSAAI